MEIALYSGEMRMATKENSLKEVYIDELKDLYNSENQLIKAIPKMAKAANSTDLRAGFEEHLEQTKNHATRLDQILEALGENPRGKKCKGMQGIVAEGSEVIDQSHEGAVRDSALIAAAQRVEHYEIAAYGVVRAFAELLGQNEAVSLLTQTLSEEKETDEKLSELAQAINQEAAQAGEIDEGFEMPKARRRAKSAGA
jgi:ferritin-like metal-binding protein YciE